MTRVEVLDEYEARPVRMSSRAAATISRLGRGRLQVLATSQDGVFEVKATHWVGTFVTDDLEVLVRPKVGLDNVLLMLDTGLPRTAWEPEVFSFATQARILPALASFFARTVERTLGQGIRRDYVPRTSREPALRGRIRFAELARQPGLVFPLPVAYEEYSADILENRAIKSALSRLLHLPGVGIETRRVMSRELGRLHDVSDVAVSPHEIDEFPLTRLNAYYEPALRLAAVVLRNLTVVDQPGATSAGSFMLNMNDLFQDFVTRRLRRALRGRLDVIAEPTRWLDRDRRVRMWPDLEFRIDGELVLVGDAKYKLLRGATARSGDYYQLLAYATALQLRHGLLIYCLAHDTPPSAVVRVVGSDVTLHAGTINLSGGDEQLRESIESVAHSVLTLASLGRRDAASRSGS
ncbi:MAG: McrC family protein [Actinomycetota bacterium]|nr:McrC family protein [Actinomycetota bacterium]